MGRRDRGWRSLYWGWGSTVMDLLRELGHEGVYFAVKGGRGRGRGRQLSGVLLQTELQAGHVVGERGLRAKQVRDVVV